MHARILLTNGRRTYDHLWLQHRGTDIYWGYPHIDLKSSYHRAGQLHTKSDGVKTDVAQCVPLAQLKGYFHLVTTGAMSSSVIDTIDPVFEYTGTKADALVTVDLRTLPAGAAANIGIGLIEAGNLAAVGSLLSPANEYGGLKVEPQQLLIATSVSPWVSVAVHWVTPLGRSA